MASLAMQEATPLAQQQQPPVQVAKEQLVSMAELVVVLLMDQWPQQLVQEQVQVGAELYLSLLQQWPVQMVAQVR
jgi:hypothetical protein